MVRLIVPRARNLSSIIDTLQVDDGWLNIQIKALGLERPSAQKGRHVSAPPAELPAFLRLAGVEEAVLAVGLWPTLKEMQARYLRVVLAHAPSFVVAAAVLRRTAASLKRQAQELGLPKLSFQRKGTMRPAPKEWAALHPLLCPAVLNFSEPICFRTFTDNHGRPEAEPGTTTRWIMPEHVRPETETEPGQHQRSEMN